MIYLPGLTKVDGHSYEEILGLLAENSIRPYRTEAPRMANGYFRSSFIRIVGQTLPRHVLGYLHPHNEIVPCDFYYAAYRIEKEFDFTKLRGKINFKEGGHLVERVRMSLR